jgi:hypothetical protein
MPKIKWRRVTKVQNKAVGLPGPEAVYADAGDEITVDAKVLDKLTELYGPEAFDVIEEPKAKAKGKTKGKGGGP